MHHALRLQQYPHCATVTHIDVGVVRPRPGFIVLRYFLTYATGDLWLPPPAVATLTDQHWCRTCCEAFVRTDLERGYYEFSFAPSIQWAAYRFTGHRSGMSAEDAFAAPRIKVRSDPEELELNVWPNMDEPAGATWRLGLSAMIEEMGGRQSYWALAHPPDQADFHHADGIACELAAVKHQ